MGIITAKMENKMADAKKAGTDVVVTGMIICRNQRPFFGNPHQGDYSIGLYTRGTPCRKLPHETSRRRL